MILALTNCVSSSPGIPDIYLVRLQHSSGVLNSTQAVVRVGYFGICIGGPGGTECNPTNGATSGTLPGRFLTFGPNRASLQPLLDVTLVLQTKVILCLLAGAGATFFIGLILL
ncbi:hypothetical protein M501DRAFT_991727 [Patellaria atrata CBS 101060]|uniref:Uncharacterized protein n=1 Tax=Patellaria atrata CBS 101060 TaxID=1346257 RepID=A0A9P4VQD7_9PEZI|nr:hypothetical protein M501DRAFT_991727 [Patellaria atrata CBS 101060]